MSRESRPHLLLVEDSPTQAAELAFLLEDAGFEVSTAGDAEQGWSAMKRGFPDALVTDLVLPGESGFDLCRRVKSNPDTRRIPVMVLTGEADPVNVLHGLEAGADGFMTKDHPTEMIVERIRRVIRQAAERDAIAASPPRRVEFLGHVFSLAVTPEQLLNVLLSAFEDGIRLNERLRQSEGLLRERHDAIDLANRALREANDVKERFLRAAAHDLRNPAGVVRSLAELLLEGEVGPLAEEQTDFVRRIARQAQGLLDLLQDLVDVSALKAGGLALRAKVQDPRQLLRDAFETAETAAAAKHIDLVWSVPEELPAVSFDSRRMEEALGNLLSNAIKFCSPGARVTLTAASDAHSVVLAVEDSGPGISEQEQTKLFEPFVRLSNRPTANEPSTGLGLSIVKEILERHGGAIEVESRVGVGSTFRLRLPRPS